MTTPSRPKVYVLPDLLPAPTSDIGGLARQLIEYADLSAVRPLLDELERHGRLIDVYEVKKWLALPMMISWADVPQRPTERHFWMNMAEKILPTFWFDIFDLTESLASLEKRISPKVSTRTGNLRAAIQQIEADRPIPARTLVYVTPDGRATTAHNKAAHAPAVGFATSDSTIDAQGRHFVNVQLNPPPAAASGVNESAAALHQEEWEARMGAMRDATEAGLARDLGLVVRSSRSAGTPSSPPADPPHPAQD